MKTTKDKLIEKTQELSEEQLNTIYETVKLNVLMNQFMVHKTCWLEGESLKIKYNYTLKELLENDNISNTTKLKIVSSEPGDLILIINNSYSYNCLFIREKDFIINDEVVSLRETIASLHQQISLFKKTLKTQGDDITYNEGLEISNKIAKIKAELSKNKIKLDNIENSYYINKFNKAKY